MIDKLLDFLMDEKMGCKEYREFADDIEDEEVAKMFRFMADQESDHAKMLKEYLKRFMINEE